jgi:hypothetical protein
MTSAHETRDPYFEMAVQRSSGTAVVRVLRLALTEHRRAEADGFDFVLAGATEPILHVLRVTGLDVALPMAPDVASALDASDGAADLRSAT